MTKRRSFAVAAALCLLPAWALAAPITYVATLSGLNESPPVASPGTGFAVVVVDPVAHTMTVDASFSDLIGTTTAAHIHCCTAAPFAGTVGVASQTPSFAGFPLGVTSGMYDSPIFDLTLAGSFGAAFLTANGGTPAGAEAALLAGLASGRAYFNVHTTQVPSGEIRGFLTVPDAGSTALLLGAALAGLAAFRRRR